MAKPVQGVRAIEPAVAEILDSHSYDPNLVERVSFRKVEEAITIVQPDPTWPARFQVLKDKIETALGSSVVSIEHVGSTSVPDLPAKNIIDIDLVVPDIEDELAFVPALEAAGFQFLLREPSWHKHRLFCSYKPDNSNLHVWGPGCPEVVRHKLFRDWLRQHPDDCVAYAQMKRESAAATTETGGNMMDYTERKNSFIEGLLKRVFKENGYL